MHSVIISAAVGLLAFAMGLVGLYLKRLLPERHMSMGSRDMIGAIMGLLSLLLALVLGILVGSARAYPRETQEMVFDAHDRAFAFFRGACQRGIYDNIKTAVDTVFVGKDRQYNRRFLQMCSHHLVEPVACTPAAGWEKGQVENQVGLVRERFFTPRLRVKSYGELAT